MAGSFNVLLKSLQGRAASVSVAVFSNPHFAYDAEVETQALWYHFGSSPLFTVFCCLLAGLSGSQFQQAELKCELQVFLFRKP